MRASLKKRLADQVAAENARLRAEADRMNAKIGEVAKRGKKAIAELAYLLAQVAKKGLYRALRYDDIGDFAVGEGHVVSKRVAEQMVAMVTDLERLPDMKAAFQAGELFWTKTRTAAAHATIKTEAEWLDAVRTQSSRAVLAKARKVKGPRAQTRKTFTFEHEDAAWLQERIDEVLREALRAGVELTPGQALMRICRGQSEETQRMSASASAPTGSVPGPVDTKTLTEARPLRDELTRPAPSPREEPVHEEGTVADAREEGTVADAREEGTVADAREEGTVAAAPEEGSVVFAGASVAAMLQPAKTALRKHDVKLTARKADELVALACDELKAQGRACSVEAIVEVALEHARTAAPSRPPSTARSRRRRTSSAGSRRGLEASAAPHVPR